MQRSKSYDVDPEALFDAAPSSCSEAHDESGSSDVPDDRTGREHYVAVEKSKLRKNLTIAFGPAYSGKGITRTQLEESDSDSDSPFAQQHYDEDGSEDEEQSANTLEDVSIVLGHQVDSCVGRATEDADENISGITNQDGHRSDHDSGSSDEDSSSNTRSTRASIVRDMMKGNTSLTASLAVSTENDVIKGQAIEIQRKIFDALLNTRIRLQKALISTNTMQAGKVKEKGLPEAPMEAAETALLALLDTLAGLSDAISDSQTGQKRKRVSFHHESSSLHIWQSIRRSETSVRPSRKIILERWSNKTKAITVHNNKSRLDASTSQGLTEVLDAQLTSSHLVTRTQTPRSCAPVQASSDRAQVDANIYDDADFYGLLLKELLEQRSGELSSAEFAVQAPWDLMRQAKTKKKVDTKASKGRRLRYTVQEKLQNFMAPEEHHLWGEWQRDELFSNLFGQRFSLDEHDSMKSEDEPHEDAEDDHGVIYLRS